MQEDKIIERLATLVSDYQKKQLVEISGNKLKQDKVSIDLTSIRTFSSPKSKNIQRAR
jgi:hypothetical protein